MRATDTARVHLQRALNLQCAVHFVWHSGPGWTIASVALLVVQGTLPVLSLYLLKLIVEAVEGSLAAPDSGAAVAHVTVLIGLAGLVALVSALFRSIAMLVHESQAQVVTDHAQDLLHAKSIEIDLEYYENAQYHDTLHRAQYQALDRPTRILESLLLIGQSGISLLAIAGLLLFSLHWGFAVVLVVAAVPGALVQLWHADKLYRWQHHRTQTERRVWYLNWLLTGDQYAKEIRLCGLGPLFMRQSKALRKQLRQEKLRIITERSVEDLVAQASQILALFGALALLAYRTMQGIYSFGDLLMY